MYRVYSMQKAAGAWRGVVATAVVLALVTAGGWMLIRAKRGGRPVDLTEPGQTALPGIRLAKPMGWTESRKQVDVMDLLLLTEPSGDTGRVLLVATWPSGYAPARQLAFSLALRLGEAGLAFYPRPQAGQNASIGPLAGQQTPGVWRSEQKLGEVLARAVCSPSGRAVGVVLRCPGRIRHADEALVEAVSSSVTLDALHLTDQLDRQAKLTGIHFELPNGAWVVEPNHPDTARVEIVGRAGGKGDWRIAVQRTWPRADGGLASLVAAYRSEQLKDMSPAKDIERKPAGVNTAWQTAERIPEDLPASLQTSLEVWAVQHRKGDAALIVGRSPGTLSEFLHTACEQIARSLRLTPAPLVVDETEAERLGARIVADVSDRGLDHWWRRSESEGWFLLEAWSDHGFLWEHRAPSESDSPRARYDGGSLTLTQRHIASTKRNWEDQVRWSVDSDGVGFRFEQRIPPSGEGDKPIHLSDSRRPAARELVHYITIGAQRYQAALPTPPNFLPDPLLKLGIWRVAREEAGRSAIFTGVARSEKMLHRRLCRSLGRLDGQDDGQGGAVYGATVRMDYETSPTRYTFAEDGRMIRMTRGEWYVIRRASRSDIEDQLGASTVADALKRWREARWLQTNARKPAPSTTTGRSR